MRVLIAVLLGVSALAPAAAAAPAPVAIDRDHDVHIRVSADDDVGRQIGRDLRRYLLRNATGAPWLPRVKAIAVRNGRIAVMTTLPDAPRGRRVARALCQLIQGADVADFTPGHRILGRRQALLRTCRARRPV